MRAHKKNNTSTQKDNANLVACQDRSDLFSVFRFRLENLVHRPKSACSKALGIYIYIIYYISLCIYIYIYTSTFLYILYIIICEETSLKQSLYHLQHNHLNSDGQPASQHPQSSRGLPPWQRLHLGYGSHWGKTKNRWRFPKMGGSQYGWFKMENPMKMDDLRVPLF